MKKKKINKLICKLIILGLLAISVITLIPKFTANAIGNPTKRIVWDLPHKDTTRDVGCEITIDGIRYTERDISTDISKLVIQKLRDSGIEVITTRKENESKSLNERIRIANKSKADLYISPHINSAINSAKGVEGYIKGDENTTKLANKILKDISDKFNTPVRKVDNTPYYNKYIEGNSMLLELGFINGSDLNYLTNNKDEIADIIYSNIMQEYYGIEQELYKVKIGTKQIGAFKNLDNAKRFADENNGYITNTKGEIIKN